MVLARAQFKEVAVTSIAIAAVLFLLIFFIGFSQAVSKVSVGKSTGDIFLQLLALRMLVMSDLILPLSLFLGVLFSVGRWYQDNEITVLSACGISLAQLIRPILLLAIVFAAVEASVSLYFGPLADRESNRLQQQSREKLSLAGIKAGIFNERGGGQGVFYAEKIDQDSGQLHDIFVSTSHLGKPSNETQGLIVAKNGKRTVDSKTGQEFLVLEGGRSYEGVPGQSEFRIVEFEAYRLRFTSGDAGSFYVRVKELATSELWQSDIQAYVAEFHWRIARPIATIVLSVIALVMAYSAPRRSRFGNLFVSLLLFFLYMNLLTIGASLLKKNAIPMEAGLWWVHIIFAVLAFYMLWRRVNNRALIKLSWG